MSRDEMLLMKPKVIEWDGTHLPEEFRQMPPGRYAIEPIDHSPALTQEEEEGIVAGLEELAAAKGNSLADAVRKIRAGYRKR